MASYLDNATSSYNLSNDPATTHTLGEFIASSGLTTISYDKLSFKENRDGTFIPVINVLRTYLYEVKQQSVSIELDDIEYEKYKYNPKRLAYDIYGNTELFFIILIINGICNIKEFNKRKILMLKKDDINDILSRIYSSEKEYIEKYNIRHEGSDT